MTNQELRNKLNTCELETRLAKLYSSDELDYQKKRLITLSEEYASVFSDNDEIRIFSAPGRSEIGGNHTDHNKGKVLAAGINLDAVAIASKTNSTVVNLKSERYEMDTIDVCDSSIHSNETTHSASLIRGVAAGFKNRGYNVGGFNAYTASNVISGSGLSSSAAFEVLVGTIFNHLFNDGKISPVEIAQIAQYAENVYFGKPCGLMDQMACSVGGFVKIDFENPEKPLIKKLDFDFASCRHALCIIDTGASHSDLTDEYASVRSEMEAVARVFGKEVLRQVPKKDVLSNISKIREEVNDRAVLRALHYYAENERVEKLGSALEGSDFEEFKKIIIESGHSSYMYNQNVYSSKSPLNQAVSVALALCDEILSGTGAYRVHGGGFAGTIQAFVPISELNLFKEKITAVFGEKSCYVLKIRNVGGVEI